MTKKTTLENENVYFPHFVSARHDRKLRRVRKELGLEGYGIFFMLLEVLREQSDLKYPIDDIDLLADEFGTSEQKIRVVICNYNLFLVDENDFFFSPKQIEYLQPYFAKSKRAKHAALKRWHGEDAFALPEHSKSNANAMQVKESKGKERKGKESLIRENHTHISLSEVEEYFKSKKANENQAKKFFNHYEAIGWRVNGNQIKNWKPKADNWISDDRAKQPNEEYKVIDGGVMV